MKKIVLPYLLTMIFALAAITTADAQTLNQYIKNGDAAYAEGDFYTAFFYYNKALQIDDTRTDVSYKFAESARKFNDYETAKTWYKNTLSKDRYLNFPLSEYYLADMLKHQGDYETALVHFKRFRDRYRQDDFFKKKAQQEFESTNWANDNRKDSLNITIEHLKGKVNTEFSEFAASGIKDTMLQLSSIREWANMKKEDNNYLSRIYTFSYKKGEWKKSKGFLKKLDDIDEHIANGSFNYDYTRFYFTVCENITAADMRCEIYVSSYKNENWSDPIRLNDEINASGFTSTQPYEGKMNDMEVLFFSSDRQGGQGKLDIWYSEMSNGNYSKPKNMGKIINSADDEASPYYDHRTDKLYFSSKWHYGFGGYDIFSSEMANDNWSEPQNLGFPINTSYNDLYFTVNENAQEGFLTSNRIGALYINGETCCNDIFKYTWEDKIEIDTPIIDTPITTVDTSFVVDTPDIITSIKQLIPVTLYFHNDEPECCNTRDTTSLNYVETYQPYTAMRDTYRVAYASKSPNIEKSKAKEDIDYLFDNYIDKGYENLSIFSELLTEILEEGRTVEVTIEGYCSPLATNPYNVFLAQRRIASLRNYFYAYDGKKYMQYIKTGQLKLKNQPFGENRADQTISDNRLDTRNSVYHPDAALERKVEIISIDIE